jgi:hypothetical protein
MFYIPNTQIYWIDAYIDLMKAKLKKKLCYALGTNFVFLNHYARTSCIQICHLQNKITMILCEIIAIH